MPQPNPSAQARAYASILVPMDQDPAAEGRARLAAELADRFSSRMIGVAAQPITAPMYFEAPVEGVASILEIEERRIKEYLAGLETVFRKAAGSRGGVEWRQALTFPLEFTLEQSRAADLIVAVRPQRTEQLRGMVPLDGGDLVMTAGRPVLFVPPGVDHLSAKRVIVGWKDTRESRRAVWDALPMLKAAQEVLVVSGAADDNAAKDVVAWLDAHAVAASPLGRTAQNGTASDDLTRIASQEAVDLIVCGAYGHSRTREWVFGGVTRDLLDHSPICCLMSH